MVDTATCETCGASMTLDADDLAVAASFPGPIGWTCAACAEKEYEAMLQAEEREREESRRMWSEFADNFYRSHPHG